MTDETPAPLHRHPFRHGGPLSTICAQPDCWQAPAARIHQPMPDTPDLGPSVERGSLHTNDIKRRRPPMTDETPEGVRLVAKAAVLRTKRYDGESDEAWAVRVGIAAGAEFATRARSVPDDRLRELVRKAVVRDHMYEHDGWDPAGGPCIAPNDPSIDRMTDWVLAALASDATPSTGLDVDALAATLRAIDYPRNTERYAEWFAATGDTTYLNHATQLVALYPFAAQPPLHAHQWGLASVASPTETPDPEEPTHD